MTVRHRGRSAAMRAYLAVCLPLTAFTACATGPGTHVDAAFASGALAPYRKIAVAGFAEGRAAGAESDIRRLAGLSLNDGPVETGAGETVAESIHIQMARAGFTLVERGKVLEAAIGEDIRRENGWAMAMAIAAATGAAVVAR